MVLGKLPVPGRPTIWIIVGQGPIALAVGADGGCLDIFTLICPGGGRVVRWSRVNFQCRGVLLVWINVGQGPTALVVCGWGLFGHFYSRLSFLFSFSLSLGDDPI